jgi:hypothetical protein
MAYLAVLGQVDLECLGIVLETERAHGKENVLAIDRFPLLLMALLGRCDRSALPRPDPTLYVSRGRLIEAGLPSLVMKEINSLTHSCMHSFASFAILAFSGSAVFMIRATGAKLRMLAS